MYIFITGKTFTQHLAIHEDKHGDLNLLCLQCSLLYSHRCSWLLALFIMDITFHSSSSLFTYVNVILSLCLLENTLRKHHFLNLLSK